jgi:signal peptidase I
VNATIIQPLATSRRISGAGAAARRLVTRVALLVIVAGAGAFTVSNLMGFETLTVRSASMTGTADVGSMVVARPITAGDVRVGQIILIRRERAGVALAPVLHRVIERQVDAAGQIIIRTKGDANTAADPEPLALRGPTVTPVLIVPHLGVAVAALQTPAGWFGLVVLPIVLALSVALGRLWTSDPAPEEEHR